jgi:DNA invertase Pin-like site-specific DNA recombinase
MSFLRAYLRASTDEQDANRARAGLDAFATERGLKIASYYTENESGASLKRPELFRLLDDCTPGDILLVEQIDRLSRLNGADWEQLKTMIAAKQVKVVALDLPTSWMMAKLGTDGFQDRMLDAINGMMLDMLAAIARKDYEDRRRRQLEGIAKAKSEGAYRGRKENTARNEGIVKLLREGKSWNEVIKVTGVSRGTVAKLARRAS